MPRQEIPAPPSAARSINLRTTARIVEDSFRWENGIKFRPEPCGPGESLDPLCADPEDEGGKDAGTPPSIVEFDPFGFSLPDSCAYALNEGLYEELSGRARRALEAQTSHMIEEALWTGVVDGIDFTIAHPNRPLIAAPVQGTPAPPVSALAQMDELLSNALGGRKGMIHVPAPLFHQFAFYGLIRERGPIWETVTGNVVVPGTGYTGTDPDGDTDPNATWIYGTSPVELRLSQVEIVPGSIDAAIDHANNEIVVRAERLALAYWDLCAHVGVPVCTTDPGPECGSES
jgi:hypothetical protein